MKITLNHVQKGEKGEHVPETTLSYESGRVTVVVAETARRPTVLALLATGRMAPDRGSVAFEVDDDALTAADSARMRATTAIVDAPDISEPVADLTLRSIVQEELMFADRPSSRRATAEALDTLGVAEFGDWEIQNVPNTLRVSVLTELAASRPEVEALVLTSPDRRGGSAFEWFEVAAGFARRGFAVLVIANESSVEMLADTVAAFDAEQQADADRRAAEDRAAEASRLEELASEHPEPESEAPELAGSEQAGSERAAQTKQPTQTPAALHAAIPKERS